MLSHKFLKLDTHYLSIITITLAQRWVTSERILIAWRPSSSCIFRNELAYASDLRRTVATFRQTRNRRRHVVFFDLLGSSDIPVACTMTLHQEMLWEIQRRGCDYAKIIDHFSAQQISWFKHKKAFAAGLNPCQRTACTPPLVVSFQWETRDLYTLVCLDQECYDECEWIDLSRGYLTWADTSSKPTTCREAPHIALRTSQFAIFWRNQPMSGLQTVIKMKKSKRFKMTVQKSPLRPMSAHT